MGRRVAEGRVGSDREVGAEPVGGSGRQGARTDITEQCDTRPRCASRRGVSTPRSVGQRRRRVLMVGGDSRQERMLRGCGDPSDVTRAAGNGCWLLIVVPMF